jgi:hypothetical protein
VEFEDGDVGERVPGRHVRLASKEDIDASTELI